MKLRATSRDKQAFTSVELLIVVGIAVVLAAAAAPIYSNVFPESTVSSTALEIADTLRAARERSSARIDNKAFGVKFFSHQYVLYEGDSYGSGIPVRTIDVKDTFFITTTFVSNDISFTKGTGTTTDGVVSIVGASSPVKNISVTRLGAIDIQ